MLAYPTMLVEPAKKAGIKVPEDADNFDLSEYPHFFVFCRMQLGRRMPTAYSHWENAKIIAKIPEDKIKMITIDEILEMGYE